MSAALCWTDGRAKSGLWFRGRAGYLIAYSYFLGILAGWWHGCEVPIERN